MSSNSVELLIWWHRRYNPANHLGLQIKTEKEEAYFSFSPLSLSGLHHLPTLQLRKGRESFIMPSADDEKLIWGLRKRWLQLKPLLTSEQISLLPENGMIAHLGDKTLLDIALGFSSDMQSKLREVGEPHIITLNHLDAQAMIQKIKYYKSDAGKQLWAPFAGNLFRQKNTHNCASIMLDILYMGKLKKFWKSPHDWMSAIMAGIGAFIGFFMHMNAIETIITAGSGFLIARFLGGLYEGYQGIQDYLIIRKLSQKDSLTTLMGFKISASLVSAVIGLFTYGPVFPTWIALPKKVINLVNAD